MKFLEKDLEDIIFENRDRIHEKGLDLRDSYRKNTQWQVYRQVPLGPYGVADLVVVEYAPIPKAHQDILTGYSNHSVLITVVECKQKTVGINTYMQAQRYVWALKKLMYETDTDNTHVKFKTILIGDSVEQNSDFVFTYNNDWNCSIYTYTYGIDGIEFDLQSHDWYVKGDMATASKNLLKQARIFFRRAIKAIHRMPIESDVNENPF